jgi:hypothetical protein
MLCFLFLPNRCQACKSKTDSPQNAKVNYFTFLCITVLNCNASIFFFALLCVTVNATANVGSANMMDSSSSNTASNHAYLDVETMFRPGKHMFVIAGSKKLISASLLMMGAFYVC